MTDDSISRKAAIGITCDLRDCISVDGYWALTERLKKLPPVQPEIIHCGDCRHWKNNHLCKHLSRYGTFETEIDFYCGFAERREE